MRPTAGRCRARSTGCRRRHALDCELRLYDRLFTVPDPDAVDEGQDFTAALNPESLVVVPSAKIEPSVAEDPVGTRYQFERTGYFMSDPVDSKPGRAGVQPHGDAPGQLGEGEGEVSSPVRTVEPEIGPSGRCGHENRGAS